MPIGNTFLFIGFEERSREGSGVMSKKSTIGKDRAGVSPVIATILLVAMTVVLAAILYVMVTSIVNGNITVTPIMSTSKTTDNENFVWTITAISGSHPVLKSDVYVQLKNGTVFIIETAPLITVDGSPGCAGTHGFNYSSSTAGDYISVGDVFRLTKTYPLGTTITLVTPDASALYTVMTV